MTAPQINSSTVIFNDARVIYSSGSGIISGDNVSEIISQTHNWFKPVRHARVVIKHAPFYESSMKVYASFRDKPIDCENETLGTGDGRIHTYQLQHTNGINFESVKVYYDRTQIFSGYEVNCQVGRITCTAPAGVLITCDYEYNWNEEEWRELPFSSLTRKPEYDESEYYLRIDEPGYICAIKIALYMKTGNITNEVIGTGRGILSTYKLSHCVKDGEVSITANNSAVSAKNFALLDDPQYIKIAASNGATLRASYSWISESPIIYEFHSVFSE